jgi:hypothetical protein
MREMRSIEILSSHVCVHEIREVREDRQGALANALEAMSERTTVLQ